MQKYISMSKIIIAYQVDQNDNLSSFHYIAQWLAFSLQNFKFAKSKLRKVLRTFFKGLIVDPAAIGLLMVLTKEPMV